MTAWLKAQLADVATIDRSTVQPRDINGGMIYVGLENILNGCIFLSKSVDASTLASCKFRFTDKHLLYGKLRPYLGKVACPNFNGICSTDILPILPGERIERRFLYHYLRQPSIVDYAKSKAVGANLPRLSPAVLSRIEIPLPPLAEQRRIAKLLDLAEAIRTKRREAVLQLGSLNQAIFLDLFGDPVLNPRGWPLKKLGEIGTLDRGVSKHRPRNAPELLGGPYPLVQTGDVANCDGYIRSFRNTYSEFGLRQSRLWPAGTLCITIAANIAKTGILMFDSCFPDSIVGFRANETATVEFVQTWLSFHQQMIEEKAPESAQKNINLTTLRDLEIPLPPIPQQRDFAHHLLAIENLKTVHRLSLVALDALFITLGFRAFRGEL